MDILHKEFFQYICPKKHTVEENQIALFLLGLPYGAYLLFNIDLIAYRIWNGAAFETFDSFFNLNNSSAITHNSLSGLNIGDYQHITAIQLLVLQNTSNINTGDNAVNNLYSGLITNQTHTGEVTGSVGLILDKTAITNKTEIVAVNTDYVLISDTSDTGNLKKSLISSFVAGLNHNDLANRDVAGNHAKLVPLVDSATAIQITKADGVTPILIIDTLTKNLITSGGILYVSKDIATEDAQIEVGSGRTANGNAYIDFIGDTTYTDYALRLFRSNGGANAYSGIYHRGTGAIEIVALEAALIRLKTNNLQRFQIAATGEMSLGVGVTNYTFPLVRGTVNQILQSDGSGVLTWQTIVPNATHTGEVTGSDVLTVDKTAITNKTTVTLNDTDYLLISDTSDTGNLKKVLASDIIKTYETTVDVSSAELKSLYTSPKTLIAAPGVGKAISIEDVVYSYSGGTKYIGDDVLWLMTKYASTYQFNINKVLSNIATPVIGKATIGLDCTLTSIVDNDIIVLTNLTADLTTGTGTLRLYIKYRIITL